MPKEFYWSGKYHLLALFLGAQYPPLEGELKGEDGRKNFMNC